MNYDHHFHAGNFADVVKHLILSRVIEYLKRKPAPFRIIDTHAGSGRYALDDERVTRNPEFRTGIETLRDGTLRGAAAELAEPYLEVIETLNPAGKLEVYPGSPLLSRHLMRAIDRLTVMELHPSAAEGLRTLFAGDIAVKTMALDGYEALPAQLPPKERRGLILVDPPFEQKGEFDRILSVLVKSVRHFAHGIYLFWYPLKDEEEVARFKKRLNATGIPAILCSELRLRKPTDPPHLFGTGMIVVNPPYTLKDELDILFKGLTPLLSDDPNADFSNTWIRPAP